MNPELAILAVLDQIKASQFKPSLILMHPKTYISYRVASKPYDMVKRLKKIS